MHVSFRSLSDYAESLKANNFCGISVSVLDIKILSLLFV